MKRLLPFAAAFVAGLAFLVAPVAASETITYTYDALGRLTAVHSSGDVNDGQAASTTYDAAGNRTNETVTGAPTTANLSIGDASITEGGTLSFTVTRTGITSSAVSVDYATQDDTAVEPGDYTATSGTVSFAANQSTATITVLTSDDAIYEGDETLTVLLSNALGGATITTATGTGTIIENDPAAQLAIGDTSATEGDTLTFTVTRSGDSSTAVSVDYATSDDSAVAPGDYIATSGTINFAANQTTATIAVATADDSAFEAAETMKVTLSGASTGATITDDIGIGAISDNDLPAQLSIGDASVTEGGALSFTVTRSGDTSSAVSAHYATGNGTAVAPGDYTAESGTVSFAANDTSETITVNTNDDSTVESAEAMSVTLSNPSSGATILTASGNGTINDNDVAPAFSIADANADEGGTLSFTVTVGAHSGSVHVTAATSNGTAAAPGDYTTKSQTLTFSPQQTSKTFSVVTKTDSVAESAEMMNVTLSNPSSGITIADGSAVGTINNVVQPAYLAIGNASVTEGATLSFTVTRSGTTSTAVSAHYATASGTATSGSDFTAKSGTVSFAANQTSASITVNTADDSTVESAETMSVNLSSPSSGATITDATGTGTIADNDTPTLIQLTDTSLNVLPAHQGTYFCSYDYSGQSYGLVVISCSTTGGIAYQDILYYGSGTPYYAPGYSWQSNGLNVMSNYYGTGHAP